MYRRENARLRNGKEPGFTTLSAIGWVLKDQRRRSAAGPSGSGSSTLPRSRPAAQRCSGAQMGWETRTDPTRLFCIAINYFLYTGFFKLATLFFFLGYTAWI